VDDADVRVIDVAARPTAVVAATTTWAQFPDLWPRLSGEVWQCLRASGIDRGCPNVMLYHDDVVSVEVGVLLDRPCRLTGRVVMSQLPGGRVATTVHHGPFADVGAAHDAVVAWCAARRLDLEGTRWEVYGPHNDDPHRQWTEVSWLL
jgi:effector-binding domain-containing protein